MNTRLSFLGLACGVGLSMGALPQPANAQYGVMYPDGSIHGPGGLLLDGPNPGRVLQQRQEPQLNRQYIDLNSGTIYRGGVMQTGPNPGLRNSICLQYGC